MSCRGEAPFFSDPMQRLHSYARTSDLVNPHTFRQEKSNRRPSNENRDDAPPPAIEITGKLVILPPQHAGIPRS